MSKFTNHDVACEQALSRGRGCGGGGGGVMKLSRWTLRTQGVLGAKGEATTVDIACLFAPKNLGFTYHPR